MKTPSEAETTIRACDVIVYEKLMVLIRLFSYPHVKPVTIILTSVGFLKDVNGPIHGLTSLILILSLPSFLS